MFPIMAIELSPEQRAVLYETRRFDTPAELQGALGAARPEIDRIVQDESEPNQSIPVTLTELRDLYLTVNQHATALAKHTYTAQRRAAFATAIRLLDTVHSWFGEGDRTGSYRARTITEVIQASRPWRARLRAFGEHAFVFEPEIADLFADVNTSGTLEEEIRDLDDLTKLVSKHQAALEGVGMSADFALEGKALLEEASGRDLAGILGLRSREEALLLRNQLLAYAVALGREARAAGINACFDDAEARHRFEASSFRNAIRKLRARRSNKGAAAEPETPAPPADPNSLN